MKKWSLIICLFPFLTSCMLGQKTEAEFHEMLDGMYEQSVPLIKVEKLQSDIEKYLILDTREKTEYAVSHIEGAKQAGYDKFDPKIVSGVDKDQPILVYCSVGYRSERIGERLQEMGFTQVYNLYGGIFEWKNHKLPVVDSENRPTEKVHTYNLIWSRWLLNGEKIY